MSINLSFRNPAGRFTTHKTLIGPMGAILGKTMLLAAVGQLTALGVRFALEKGLEKLEQLKMQKQQKQAA